MLNCHPLKEATGLYWVECLLGCTQKGERRDTDEEDIFVFGQDQVIRMLPNTLSDHVQTIGIHRESCFWILPQPRKCSVHIWKKPIVESAGTAYLKRIWNAISSVFRRSLAF